MSRQSGAQGGRGRGRGSGGGRGGGRSSHGRRDCINFKLLGNCERHGTGECHFDHSNKEKTVHETVKIPNRVPLSVATKGEFLRVLQNIAECRLRASSELTSVDIVVSEFNAHHLTAMEREYKKLLSQLYPIGPGWCYIHREGVEQCVAGGSLQFSIYEGRLPPRPGEQRSRILHELCMTEAAGSDEASGPKEVVGEMKSPRRESETKEGLHKAIDRVHGKGEDFNPRDIRKDIGVKIMTDHEIHMKEMLEGGLEWFCSEKRTEGQFVAKLEGRFGKILWKSVPEDMLNCNWGLKQFADLCFSDTRHSRVFTTDVKQENAAAVREQLNEERISLLETFDIKFTIMGHEKRGAVDVRIKFVDGRPTVLAAKKNEAKILIFDVLCLHRNHDIRMTLNYYEVMSPDSPEYRVLEQLLKTVSLSDPQTISLVTTTDKWSVNFIRHKKREAYRIDDKFIVTVTNIRECQFTKEPRNTPVSLTNDRYCKNHTEIESHNCSWECAFGRDVNFPPEKALALHMEDPVVSPAVVGTVPHPWQPEHILEDFQEFYENLDTLNEMLGQGP